MNSGEWHHSEVARAGNAFVTTVGAADNVALGKRKVRCERELNASLPTGKQSQNLESSWWQACMPAVKKRLRQTTAPAKQMVVSLTQLFFTAFASLCRHDVNS